MKNTLKRILSMMLAVLMMVSLLPVNALAAGPDSGSLNFQGALQANQQNNEPAITADWEIEVGQTKDFQGSGGTHMDRVWNCDNTNVASIQTNRSWGFVSSVITVTGIAPGYATITQSWENNVRDTFILHVKKPTPTISISPTSVNLLGDGTTTTLTATLGKIDYVDNKETIWSSSNESVATVDQNGVVTAVSAGTATINAALNYVQDGVAGSVSSSGTVTVTVPESSSTLTMKLNDAIALSGNYQGKGSNSNSWAVDDASIVSIQSGSNTKSPTIKANALGWAKLTNTYKNSSGRNASSYTQYVYVHVIPSIEAGPVNVNYGTTGTSANVSGADGYALTYSVLNPDIAIIESNGIIITTGVGTTNYTVAATKNGQNCGSSTATITVKPDVSVENVTLYEGQTVSATATANPADCNLSFSSGDSSIATCTTDGTVHGVKAGSTTINVTASKNNITNSDSKPLNVLSNAYDLTVDNPGIYLTIGKTFTFNASYLLHAEDGRQDYDNDITWQVVEGNDLITLSANSGTTVTATAVRETGTAKIKVSLAGEETEITINLKDVSFTVDPTSAQLYIGQTKELQVASLDVEQEQYTVISWESDNENVATVDNNGVATAVSSGTANIKATVKYANKDYTTTNSCEITVISNVAGVLYTRTDRNLDPNTNDTSVTIPEGAENTFRAIVTKNSEIAGTDPKILYSSSNSEVVSAEGIEGSSGEATVTALTKGTADVIAASEGSQAVAHVTVISNIDKINLEDNLTIYKNTTKNIAIGLVDYVSEDGRKLSSAPGDGGYEVEYKTSNAGIVDVINGELRGVSKGTAVVTVTIDGIDHQINVTVKDSIESFTIESPIELDITDETPKPISGDVLDVTTVKYVDESGIEQTVPYKESAIQPEIIWTSLNEDIATVTVNDNGEVIITGLEQGNATITAETGGMCANVLVKVTKNGEEKRPDENKRYTVTIKYVFGAGSKKGTEAADPFIGRYPEGSVVELNVTSPSNIIGYAPEVAAYTETIPCLTAGIERTVYYYPAPVNYTVNYYLETAVAGEYELHHTTIFTGNSEDKLALYISEFDVPFDIDSEGTSVTQHYRNTRCYNREETIAADGTTVVNIQYDRKNYLVDFSLDGGYGVSPIYGAWGKEFSVDNSKVLKTGYVFAGWYDNAELSGNPVDLSTSQILQRNVTYYAKWTKATTYYTVIHWLEKSDSMQAENATTIDPANYDFKELETKQNVATGSRTNATAKSTTSGDYKGFTAMAVTQQIVEGDGSTIVNVYYARDWHTLTFKANNTKVASIHAKYGSNITAEFNAINETYPGYTWKSDKYSEKLQTLDIMPNFDTTFIRQDASSTELKTIYYYVQKVGVDRVSTSWPTSPGDSFEEIKRVGTKFNYITYEEEYHPIEGFERYSKPSNVFGSSNYWKGSTPNRYQNLYYKRLSYELSFINGDLGTVHKESVQYQAPLSGYSYTPNNRPNSIPASYEFKGWCSDPACTTLIDFNSVTMPAGNYAVYAKWAPKVVTLRVISDNIDNETNSLLFENIPCGTIYTEDPTWSAIEEGEEREFIGWFYCDDTGVITATPFSFSLPIEKNTIVQAKFRNDNEVDVIINYVSIDGTQTLAASTEDPGFEGDGKTYTAKIIGNGWFPLVNSHAFTLTPNIHTTDPDVTYREGTSGNDTYEYSFKYVQKDEVNYTVYYINEITGEEVHRPTTGSTKENVITVSALAVDGYQANERQKTFLLTANDQDNVITFTYRISDGNTATVDVFHWKEDPEHPGNYFSTEYSSATYNNVTVGEPFTNYDQVTITGYHYDHTTCNPADSDGVVTSNGLTINLYYNCNEYNYKFEFKDYNTKETIADPIIGTAKYNSAVTKDAKDIPGYTLQSDSSLTINSISNDESRNGKVFYYTEQTVTIRYESVTAGCDVTKEEDRSIPVRTGRGEIGSTANTVEGYDFIGWYSEETCKEENKLSGNATFVPSKNSNGIYEAATYYAKWQPKTDAGYKVHYIEKGTTNKLAEDKVVENQTFNSETKETAESVEGFTVDGNGIIYARAGYNKEYTFFYTRNSHTITYIIDGEYFADDNYAKYENVGYAAKHTLEADALAKTGITFSGWSSDDVTISDGKFDMPDKNVTIKGHYTPDPSATIDVTYTAQAGGSVNNGKDTIQMVTAEVLNGSTATALPGYTFGGWYKGSQKIGENELLTADQAKAALNKSDYLYEATEFTAHFTPIDYTISYSWQNAPSADVELFNNSGNPVSIPVVPSAINNCHVGEEYIVDITYSGSTIYYTHDEFGNINGSYTFSDWSSSDVSITGRKIIMPAKNVALTGSWTFKPEEVPTHMVSYEFAWDKTSDPMPAESMIPALPATASYVKGQTYTVADGFDTALNVFDQYGNKIGAWSFQNWNKTGVQTMGNQNETVTGTWKYFQDMTDWSRTVTYKFEGDIPAGKTAPVTETYTNGQTVTVQPLPEMPTGYSFDGWYNGDTKVPSEFVIDTNVELTGRWTLNTYRYTVEYYYDGNKDSYKTENSEALFGSTISEYTEKNITGYKLEKTENLPLTISDNLANNVIKVYYIKDIANYTINYFLKGTVTAVADSVSASGTIGDTIAVPEAQLKAGFSEAVKLSDSIKSFVVDADGNTINVYFTVPLTITAKDASRAYNGQPLIQDEVVIEGLVNGDTVSGIKMTAESTITNAGKVANVIDEDTINVPDYYTVTCVPGELTVTANTSEVVVTITGNSDSKVYNATEQSVTGFTTDVGTKTINVALAEGSKAEAKGTDVGEYKMNLTKDDFVVTSANYSNIKIKVEDGMLKIDPKVVTVVADEKSKSYGTADPELTATVSGLVKGEAESLITYKLTRVIGEDVGEYAITPSGDEYQGNYKVEYVPNILTIYKSKILITVNIYGNTGTYEWDGEEHIVEGYTTDVGGKPISVALNANAYAIARGTAPGKYNMGLTTDCFDVTSKNYETIIVNVKDGWLWIGLPPEELEEYEEFELEDWEEVPDGNGGFILVPIDEDAVPLAFRENTHKDAALPFIFVLTAFLTQLVYNDERKKHTKKIFELKKQLATGEKPEEDK